MNLYHDGIRTAGSGGIGHGCHQIGLAGGVTGVHHYRQMGQVVQHRHGGQIQGVRVAVSKVRMPRSHRMICSLPSLIMYSALISSSCRVLARPRLRRMGFLVFAQFLQQVKILHISGTYLNDVHIGEQIQGGDVHDLGDDGKSLWLPWPSEEV